MQTVGTNDDDNKPTEPQKYSHEWWRAKAGIVWKFTWENISTLLSVCALVVSLKACDNNNRSATAAGQSAANSERSADAAERSATVAEKAYQTTIKNFQLDQRARIGVRGIKYPPDAREGVEWVFNTDCVNSGKTPALNTKSIMVVESMPKDDPFAPTYDEKAFASSRGSVGTVAVGAPISAVVKGVPTKEQVDIFTQGRFRLYVYGEISYDDVFGHPHCLTYCFYFLSNFSDAMSCETYNPETDTKCKNIP